MCMILKHVAKLYLSVLINLSFKLTFQVKGPELCLGDFFKMARSMFSIVITDKYSYFYLNANPQKVRFHWLENMANVKAF